jgi:hypothetical protein
MLDAGLDKALGELTAIGGAVVAHDPFEADAVGSKEGAQVRQVTSGGSTINRHTGILVGVHPGLRLRVGWLRNPSLTACSR